MGLAVFFLITDVGSVFSPAALLGVSITELLLLEITHIYYLNRALDFVSLFLPDASGRSASGASGPTTYSCTRFRPTFTGPGTNRWKPSTCSLRSVSLSGGFLTPHSLP